MLLPSTFIAPYIDEWTFEEFVAFLLIYVSYADLDFCDAEKTAIVRRVGPAVFEKVSQRFHRMGEYEKLEFVLAFKQRFYPDESGRQQILELITSHFMEDGEVSKLESNLLNFLSRLL